MRKQILLMCDDFSFCRRFQETMQDDTTTIQYFLTVADALDSYTRQRYCLVIMDSCLENVDSQKLLQMMHRAKPVPILVLTDGKSVEDEIKFFSLGQPFVSRSLLNYGTSLLSPALFSNSIWCRSIQKSAAIPCPLVWN